MISVQSAMLVALGFLIAGLLGLLIGSALWSRAVRLTTRRIKQSLPVSETEIRADRDRLRAEFAVKVHKLETALEQAKLERARQFIEVNRRDAAISTLESTVGDLRVELDEHINARRVLEQTVSDRLPRVEARLAEAKRLLFNRDREIAELTATARRHKIPLGDGGRAAKQPQLSAAAAEQVPDAAASGDGSRAGDLVLRTEIETLRTKTREQAALIERLQQRLAQSNPEQASGRTEGDLKQKTAEIARLERKLAESEEALAAIRASTSDIDAARIAFESEVRALKSKTEDQEAEIARLAAALEAFDRMDAGNGAVKESKMVLKARLGSAQAQSDQQAATIGRLRAELAATQDRLSRQAAHFMDEMRRVAQTAAPAQSPRRRTPRLGEESIVERLGHVRPITPESRDRQVQVQALASQIKRAQVSVGRQDSDAAATGSETPAAESPLAADAETAPIALANGAPEAAAEGAAAAELPQAASMVEERRRPRLLDRLTGSKSHQG